MPPRIDRHWENGGHGWIWWKRCDLKSAVDVAPPLRRSSLVSGLLPSSRSPPKTSAPCRTSTRRPSRRTSITASPTGFTGPTPTSLRPCPPLPPPPRPPATEAQPPQQTRYRRKTSLVLIKSSHLINSAEICQMNGIHCVFIN